MANSYLTRFDKITLNNTVSLIAELDHLVTKISFKHDFKRELL